MPAGCDALWPKPLGPEPWLGKSCSGGRCWELMRHRAGGLLFFESCRHGRVAPILQTDMLLFPQTIGPHQNYCQVCLTTSPPGTKSVGESHPPHFCFPHITSNSPWLTRTSDYSSQPKAPTSPSTEASDTRSHPLERAAQTTNRVQTMRGNTKNRPLASVQASSSETFTPVSSFIPTGVSGLIQPLGKYYPSNYENRPSRQSSRQPKTDATPSQRPAPTTPATSEPHIPPCRQEPAPVRSPSDLERRMQQYQRDMVSQAATAAHAVMKKRSTPSLGPTAGPRKAARPTRIALPGNFRPEGLPENFSLDGLLNVQLRPRSPRLAPLGSPGPVTPMNLEDAHGDCYWDRGRGTPGSSAGYQARIRV